MLKRFVNREAVREENFASGKTDMFICTYVHMYEDNRHETLPTGRSNPCSPARKWRKGQKKGCSAAKSKQEKISWLNCHAERVCGTINSFAGKKKSIES